MFMKCYFINIYFVGFSPPLKGSAINCLILLSDGPQEKRLTVLWKYCRRNEFDQHQA